MKKLLAAVAVVATLHGPGHAGAQTYPSRPITMIVPFAAGGPTDRIGCSICVGAPTSWPMPGARSPVGRGQHDAGQPLGRFLLRWGKITLDCGRSFFGMRRVPGLVCRPDPPNRSRKSNPKREVRKFPFTVERVIFAMRRSAAKVPIWTFRQPRPKDRAVPRILVIDDQNPGRTAIALALRANGFDVAVADSGQCGLSKFEQSSFDLAIADLFMPGIDGVTFIKTLRERNAGFPVIAMSGVLLGPSGRTALDQVQTIAELSDVICLRKPFRPNELLQAVAAALAPPQAAGTACSTSQPQT